MRSWAGSDLTKDTASRSLPSEVLIRIPRIQPELLHAGSAELRRLRARHDGAKNRHSAGRNGLLAYRCSLLTLMILAHGARWLATNYEGTQADDRRQSAVACVVRLQLRVLVVVFVVLDAALEIVATPWGCLGTVLAILAISTFSAYHAVISREPELPEKTFHYPGEFAMTPANAHPIQLDEVDRREPQRSSSGSSRSANSLWSPYADEPCAECDWPGDSLTMGDGNCNVCHGTGIADFVDAVASGPAVGDCYNCRRCSGSGVCPRCNGRGVLYW